MTAAMAVGKDHYEILGVQRRSSAEEIRKAYKKQAMKLHPDRNPEGADLFKQVTNAYQVLTSPHQKRRYDDQLARQDLRSGRSAASKDFHWPPRPTQSSASHAPAPKSKPPDMSWFNQFPQPKFHKYGEDMPPRPPQPQGDGDNAFRRRQGAAQNATPRDAKTEEELRRRRREDEDRQRQQRQQFAQKDVNFAQWYKEKVRETDEEEVRLRARAEMERRRRSEQEQEDRVRREEDAQKNAERSRRMQEERLAERRAAEQARRRAEDDRRRRYEEEQRQRCRDNEEARRKQMKEVDDVMTDLQRRRQELERERGQHQKDAVNLSAEDRARIKEMRERRARDASASAAAAEHKIQQLRQQQQQDRVQMELDRRHREEQEKREEEEHRSRLARIHEEERLRKREAAQQSHERNKAAAHAAAETKRFHNEMRLQKQRHEEELASMRAESDRIEQEMLAKLEAVRAAKREGKPIPKDIRLSPISSAAPHPAPQAPAATALPPTAGLESETPSLSTAKLPRRSPHKSPFTASAGTPARAAPADNAAAAAAATSPQWNWSPRIASPMPHGLDDARIAEDSDSDMPLAP